MNDVLYDVIRKTYLELYKGKKFPVVLKFRLNNFGARSLNYDDFAKYFGLSNRFEVFNFLLNDDNLEEILRYASSHISDNYKYLRVIKKDYINDAKNEHEIIDKSMEEEEKGYKK